MSSPAKSMLSKVPECRQILEYLEEHGPSTTQEIRASGIEYSHGLTRRMHDAGLIRRVVCRPRTIWEVA